MGHPAGQIVSIIFVIAGSPLVQSAFSFTMPWRSKSVAHRGAFEHGRFVEFAGDAPGGGEIDEDGMTLLQFRLRDVPG